MFLNFRFVLGLLTTFNRFDADGSGAIEYPEFEPLLKCILTGGKDINFDPSKKMIAQFWVDIDEDGEGTISFEEFFNWIMRLRGFDTNSIRFFNVFVVKMASKVFKFVKLFRIRKIFLS